MATAAGPELIIETVGLTKRYRNGITAVDGLDLQVKRGEVYGFLGPNGAGKSTTMRMLVGLMRPTAGSATVVGAPPGKRLDKIGSLVESPAFYPYLSGRDNLRVLARYAGVSYSRVDHCIDVVDLTGRAKHKYSTYSMGMRQRLGVAGALLKDPDLLILDEPSNGLDPQGIVEMRDLLRRLGRGERTVMLSSHLLAEVEHVCDRVGVIVSGKIVAQGTLEELRGGGSLTIVANPVDTARTVLMRVIPAGHLHEEGGRFRIDIDPGQAAALNRALVMSDVDVSELRVMERSLEDVFLQLTGEDTMAGQVDATARATTSAIRPTRRKSSSADPSAGDGEASV